MRTLALLLVLSVAAPAASRAQEAEAPDGSVVRTAELAGAALNRVSPALRADIDALVGQPLDRDRVAALTARLEAENPDIVAAVRAVALPGGEARVIFLLAQISDDAGLEANINARYRVESVGISGVPESRVSQRLRDDLQTLVGTRLDPEAAERLRTELAGELPGYDITRRISRGSQQGLIRVVFDAAESEARRWIPFIPSNGKLVYHGDLGWSGVLDIPMGGRSHRFTAGFALGNDDDLIEEYSGYRLLLESRRVVTERLGASLEVSHFRQTWHAATLAALASDPGIPEAYRERLTVEPAVTVALTRQVRATTGVSISELESLARSPASERSGAALASIAYDQRWERSDVKQSAAASYELRSAAEALGSDMVYTRHAARVRYAFEQGRSAVIAGAAVGRITGRAPLFERFTLGDTSTLRGWNRFDVAPAGGDSMFHQSVEYRYRGIALFLDTGSVWESGAVRRIRAATGFGYHGDGTFLTVGFPLNAGGVTATFMMGARF